MVENTYRPVGRDLKDYLLALKNCPDGDLTGELGIYDNWPILLGREINAVAEDFRKSGIWRKPSEDAFYSSKNIFDHKNGVAMVRLSSQINDMFLTDYGQGKVIESKNHSDFQKSFAKCALMVHPAQDPDEFCEGGSWARKMAEAIEDIGKYAIENNLPLCFPHSKGRNHRKSEDYSRIVYYLPE